MALKIHSVTLRRRAVALAGRVAAPAILRLSLGRWVKSEGRAWFAAGFADSAVTLPPVMSGLLAMPGGRQMLRDAATYAWHKERGSLDPGGAPDLGGNLYTAWTGAPIGFLHFEKCGGTAIMHWLSRNFHPLQINPDDHRDLPPHLCHRTPAFHGVNPARYSLIWGHYDLPTLRRFGPAHLIFTVLREPRARVLSLYNFWRSVNPAQIDPDLSFSVALAHRLSLEDFLACDDPLLTDLIDNLYTRRLTGLYATGAAVDPLRVAPEAALEQAMQLLAALDFVGITERMAESLARLAARIGAPAPGDDFRANVGAENHTDPSGWFRAIQLEAPSDAALAALDRRTKLDQALYARAVAAFKAG